MDPTPWGQLLKPVTKLSPKHQWLKTLSSLSKQYSMVPSVILQLQLMSGRGPRNPISPLAVWQVSCMSPKIKNWFKYWLISCFYKIWICGWHSSSEHVVNIWKFETVESTECLITVVIHAFLSCCNVNLRGGGNKSVEYVLKQLKMWL